MTMPRTSSRPPPAATPERFEGPAGVRLVVPVDGGFAIRWETGPAIGDPFTESLAEARAWALEIVNAKGIPLHTRAPAARPPPNENVDALAKAWPRPAPLPRALRTSHRGRA